MVPVYWPCLSLKCGLLRVGLAESLDGAFFVKISPPQVFPTGPKVPPGTDRKVSRYIPSNSSIVSNACIAWTE